MFSACYTLSYVNQAIDLQCQPDHTVTRNPFVQTDVEATDDKAYFRELEAIYTLRLLLLSCTSNLEMCAYELQDASAILTAKLQSMPRPPSPVDSTCLHSRLLHQGSYTPRKTLCLAQYTQGKQNFTKVVKQRKIWFLAAFTNRAYHPLCTSS